MMGIITNIDRSDFMKDIFEGLEGLGLDHIEEDALFEQGNKIEDTELMRKQQEEVIRDILFDGKAECPVCDMRFTTRKVKSGKLKLVKSDTDLRPIYDKLDPLLYDVTVCPTCGYASLAKTFKYVKEALVPVFKDKVSTKYQSKKYPDIYNYDIAIEQYKLALYDGLLLNISNCEKAYLCLKLAWLYRGKQENDGDLEPNTVTESSENEMAFLEQAYLGFKMAIDKEPFPQLGIDSLTVHYLIGELARRLGYLDEAFEVMRKLSISNRITHRLKMRVTTVKELIVEQFNEEKERSSKEINEKTSKS